MRTFCLLSERGVLQLSGPDTLPFLQGLITNDITRLSTDTALYTLLLSAQGRFLHDFFLIRYQDNLLIDCEKERCEDLLRRLRQYRLRSKVDLQNVTNTWSVISAFGEKLALPASSQTVEFFDPRWSGLGQRILLPQTQLESFKATLMNSGEKLEDSSTYNLWRLSQGIPEGSQDLIIERSFPIEYNMDYLNAISWSKGCYVGQELTTRMKHQDMARRRLRPAHLIGPLPLPGTPIYFNGEEVGEIRSGQGQIALALLKREVLEAAGSFTAADTQLIPFKPQWISL